MGFKSSQVKSSEKGLCSRLGFWVRMNIQATVTPLVDLSAFSTLCGGRRVLGKLECLQKAKSFKYRGILHLCKTYQQQGKKMLVSSSGGNAGFATAVVGKELKMDVVVFVPSSTQPFMRGLIEKAHAKVVVAGEHWAQANEAAQAFLKERGEECGFVHPFDNPILWEGHSQIVQEIKEQLNGERPDVIVLSVGGGGLLLGVHQGLANVGWGDDVRIMAVETFGAESLNASVVAGQHVTLDGIKSVAKTLGAVRVADACYALSTRGPDVIQSVVVSDEEAVDAISIFRSCKEANGALVEPACGAALAALSKLTWFRESDKLVVVIVCGGSAISDELLDFYKKNCYTPTK